MLYSIQVSKEVSAMMSDLFSSLYMVSRVILKGENFIFPSSSEGRCMIKLSICISLTKLENSRICFPKIFFTLEYQLVLLKVIVFKIVKKTAMGVIFRLLDTI